MMPACLCLHRVCSGQQSVLSTVAGSQGLALLTVFPAGCVQAVQEECLAITVLRAEIDPN